jgi:hypothetical protein
VEELWTSGLWAVEMWPLGCANIPAELVGNGGGAAEKVWMEVGIAVGGLWRTPTGSVDALWMTER